MRGRQRSFEHPARAAAAWPLVAVWAALTLAGAFAGRPAWARTTEGERAGWRDGETRAAAAPSGPSAATKSESRRQLAAARLAISPSRHPALARQRSDEPASDTTITLYLLGTTDVHGHIFPYDYYARRPGPGLITLAPLVDSVRAAHPGATYLFDSGDLLQGTPLTLLAARPPETAGASGGGGGGAGAGARAGAAASAAPNPVIRAMNLLGYAASAVGNHEYNYGIPALDRALAQARFPFVAANVFVHGTARHAYSAYTLIPHVVSPGDTILIGVTGITPPGVLIWDRANVAGKLDFRDPVASLKPLVAEMKARGADVVVVLNHGGLAGSSYDTTRVPAENAGARIAREVRGVDVVFLGHTHRELADSAIGDVLLTQAGNWARSLADVELTLTRRGPSDWVVTGRRATLLRPGAFGPSAKLLQDSLRAAHEQAVDYVASVIGHATAAMDASHARTEDTPILDFVNEVQRRVAGAQLSATAAFSLRAEVPAGPVTIGQIAALYPYENTLAAVRITGAQLKAYLEKSAEYFRAWPTPPGEPLIDPEVPGYNFDVVSGVDYTIDLARPVGQRIIGLRWQGRPVRPAQRFTLALNNYRQGGGGGFGMVAGAPTTYVGDADIRDLLVRELRRRGTIRPADYFHRNWRIVPEAARQEAERELGAASRRPLPAVPDAAAPAATQPREPKRLRVLTTNDLHGHLLPETYGWSGGRPVGGAAALATYFRAERDSFPGPTILLDAGDELQGTPVSNLSQGRATVAVLDALGVRGAAIGNHEFDWGRSVLRGRLTEAHYPWLAANLRVAGSDTLPSWVRDTATFEVRGVRVGLIGLATQATPSTTKADNVAGLDFRDGAAAIDRWVPVLRRQADFVIVIAHSGASCDSTGTSGCKGEVVDWARRAHERPDLIVAGHTHTLVRTTVNDIPIVQAASYGTRFGVVDLQQATPPVAGPGATVTLPATARIRDVPVAWADSVRPDPAVAALVARWQKEVAPQVSAVVARLAQPLPHGHGDFALARLLADAWRAETGAQVAFMNNGGVRAELRAGPVTWGQLFELLPFQNRLVVLTLTGARLRQAVEAAVRGEEPDLNVSGIRAEYDPARPVGKRVLALTLADGTPVQDGATYTVAVQDFLAGGGDRYDAFRQPVARRDPGTLDLDAFIAYLKKQPQPVAATADARLVRIGPGPERSRP